MKKPYLKLLLLTVAIAAAASTATTAAAQATTQVYGRCGDRVIEVNPYAGAQRLTPTQTSPFMQPSQYFYTDTAKPPAKSYIYSPHTQNGQPQWPRGAGEMCDGLDSTLLCAFPGVGSGVTQQQGCELVVEWPSNAPNAYTMNLCSIGMGNGIIQPAPPFNEQCDDGNITGGDGCSPYGKYEYPKEKSLGGICGDGVKDTTETCDDGNLRSGDGCSSTCEKEPDFNCYDVPSRCGDGKVDYYLGEQCDDGTNNGTDSSNCNANCVLKSSPSFSDSDTNLAYWDNTNGFRIDLPDSKLNDPDAAVDYAPVTVKKMFADGHITLSHRNQVIEIKKIATHKSGASGVLLSGQNISDLGEGEVYNFNMVVSMPDASLGEKRWDDDAFGIVFGMKRGNQTDPDSKYLMLSWRSFPTETDAGLWAYPGCQSSSIPHTQKNNRNFSLYGNPGLRLYQITGSPSYTQLWTMSQDCTQDYNGNSWKTRGSIKEIRTDNTQGWTDTGNNFPWKPSAGAWNKLINPFLPLNTFYAVDFNLGQEGVNQRLQINAEFSKEYLKVWVNRQPAIHITKDQLARDPDYNDVAWPTEGELGFYVMGVDNLTIDTSGTYYDPKKDKDAAGNDIATSKTYSKCTPASPVCGDGEKGKGEECDDGNTLDYDGCSSTCKKETDPSCSTKDDDTLCYGGSIEQPEDGTTVGTTTPTISGDYEGATGNIIVEVKESTTNKVVCYASLEEGSISTQQNGKKANTWELETCLPADASSAAQPINLKNGEYTVTATFVPTQTTSGVTFKDKEVKSTFTVDAATATVHIDQPPKAPKNTYLLSNGKITASGTSTNAKTVDVTVCVPSPQNNQVCSQDPSKKSTTNVLITSSDGTWSEKVDVPTDCAPNAPAPPKKCLVEVTPVSAAGTQGPPVTRSIAIVPKFDLPKPAFTTPDDNTAKPPVVLNPDNTLTVQGKLPSGTTTFDSRCVDTTNGTRTLKPKCQPLYVKLTVKCDAHPSSTYSINVPIHRNLMFEKDIPIPEECSNTNDTFELKGQTESALGIVSNPTTIVNVTIKGKKPAKVEFTCPVGSNATCQLPNNNSTSKGLVVNGKTNIASPRTVIVKAYSKSDPNAPCKMEELINTTADASIPVRTTNQGTWAADIPVRGGAFCLVAELKSLTGKTIATTIKSVTHTGSSSSSDISNAQPYFTVIGPTNTQAKQVEGGKEVASDIVNALKQTETQPGKRARVPVSISVAADGGVLAGDTCNIYVEGDDEWKASGTFRFVKGKFTCTADIPVYNKGKSLAGKKLVGKAINSTDEDQKSQPTDPGLTIPDATITVANGKATITLGENYPGAAVDRVITFTKDDGDDFTHSLECQLNKENDTYTCKATIPPTYKGKTIGAKLTNGTDVDPIPAIGVVKQETSAPEDGSQTSGSTNPQDPTGTISYSKGQDGGSVTVTDIDGVAPGQTISITPTYSTPGGGTVPGQPVKCTVKKFGHGLLECNTTLGKDNPPSGVPADAIPSEIKATDSTGKVIGTWNPANNGNGNATTPKVTASYIDGNKVQITIPNTLPLPQGSKLKVSLKNPNESGKKDFTCVVQNTTQGYQTCTSDQPFVNSQGKEYSGNVDITTVGQPPRPIGINIPLKGYNTDTTDGFVSGGCSTTSNPASGLLALLLGALGFFAIRRRRD